MQIKRILALAAGLWMLQTAIPAGALPVLTGEGRATVIKAVAAECGDASLGVQIGLASLILRRMETPGFADTAAGVVYSDGFLACTRTGRIALPVSEEKRILAEYALMCASAGMDPTDGALYFMSGATGGSARGKQVRFADGGYLFYG